MFKFNDKEYKDEELALAFWKRIENRMAICKDLADKIFSSMNRKPHYRLEYSVDSGVNTTYANLNDDEVRMIENVIAELKEDGFVPQESKKRCLEDPEEYTDIDWMEYIPEKDLHWAGGLPSISLIDLDDVKYYTDFTIIHSDGSGKEYSCIHMINISDEIYKDLLALKLFDEELTFNDLSLLRPDIFKRINEIAYIPHHNYMITMSEINKVAANADKSCIPDFMDNPFVGIFVNNILKHQKEYGIDESLLLTYRLATHIQLYPPYIV